MPDENGTEATRPDAVSVEESIFGDAADKADDAPAEAVEQVASGDAEQDAEVAADNGDKSDAEAETEAADELKVVVSIKGGRAVIGVQQPSSDPHIETFEDHDLPALAQEVVGVTERARARWEEAPKHPAYERPAPPPKRRNRRQQGAAQDANAETQEAETQQQTLRLF
ncbi:MAG: hypothetical protein OYI31_08720 [Chloroflexota bacterium]|nr:hypothetical protein [Chloroflexota bacterium]